MNGGRLPEDGRISEDAHVEILRVLWIKAGNAHLTEIIKYIGGLLQNKGQMLQLCHMSYLIGLK